MSFTISGKAQAVRLSPDDLDQLLDALDSLHQPLRSQDMHDALRRRLSIAYDESQR
jgi:hypothetical protein